MRSIQIESELLGIERDCTTDVLDLIADPVQSDERRLTHKPSSKWAHSYGQQTPGRERGLVLEPRIPTGAAPIRRRIEHGPDRHEVWRAARILTGIGGRERHLSAPKVADGSVAASEHV